MNYTRALDGRTAELVRPPKTSELIAARLRRQIVLGAVRPGENLPPETQLMEQFGVSRPTIREAFRILETECLIVVRAGSRGGAEVLAPELTVATRYFGLMLQLRGATIDDVYEARMVAEPACAGLLALRRTVQDLADLLGVVAEIESAIESRDGSVSGPVPWCRLAHRFHGLIMQRSGNKTLALQSALLHAIVETHIELAMSASFDKTESPERFRRSVRAYKELLALIEAEDADGAERLWRGHMESGMVYLRQDALRDKTVVELYA